MKHFGVLCLAVVLGVHSAISAPPRADIKPENFESILLEIPPEERLNFVKYHLNLGYDLAKNKASWPADVTSELASTFYKFAVENLQITDPQRLREAREIICFEDGVCIDIGDTGVHP